MTISAKDVMGLRQITGLGMMECKQALIETSGDADQAVELLRKKGLAKMDGRSDRASAEGRIAATVTPDGSRGAIVEVNSETDFTSANDAFVSMVTAVGALALEQPAGEAEKTDAIQALIDEVRLTTKENIQFARGQVLGGTDDSRVGTYLHFTGKVGVAIELAAPGDAVVGDDLLTDLCMHIAAVTPPPMSVDDDGVPADVIEKERRLAKEQAMEQGKPEQIAEKMVEGKVRKFLEENVLLKQAFVKDDKKRIKDLLPKGVSIRKFARYQLGG